MHLTRLPAAAVVGLLAAHPSPSQDAQSDPDRTVVGDGPLPAGWRAQPRRERPLGVATAGRDVRGPVGYAVDHTLDAHIGAFELHRQ